MSHKFFGSVNLAGIYTLRQKTSRFVRENEVSDSALFIAISLVTPDKTYLPDSTYSVRLQSDKIVTQSGTITLAELPDNALVGFNVSIASQENTEFSHGILKDANSENFAVETEFTVYTDGNELNGIMPHVGYDIPDKQLLALVRNHVQKMGKTQQWKRSKGEYNIL